MISTDSRIYQLLTRDPNSVILALVFLPLSFDTKHKTHIKTCLLLLLLMAIYLCEEEADFLRTPHINSIQPTDSQFPL